MLSEATWPALNFIQKFRIKFNLEILKKLKVPNLFLSDTILYINYNAKIVTKAVKLN